MDTISQAFSMNHRRCDTAFVTLEQALSRGDWGAARLAGEQFLQAMGHHFEVEEEHLFPALLAAAGAQGPVQVMRMEHNQMRQLFSQLETGLAQGDQTACLDVTETLLLVMQQHNMKEENILYRLADQVLDRQVSAVLGQLQGT